MGEEKQEKIAPKEGGWGWFVAVGMAILLTVTAGPLGAFGFLFGEFLESLGEGTQGITVISSVNFLCFSFTGLVTNYSLRSFSSRQVCLFGSFLFIAGNLLTVFATSMSHMLVTYGLIPGIGMGLMVPATFHSFNTYFVRRRTFVMSISQAIIGAGCMVYPMLIEFLMTSYGFRGAQAIVSALSLNTILASLVMKTDGKPVGSTETYTKSDSVHYVAVMRSSNEHIDSCVHDHDTSGINTSDLQVKVVCDQTTQDDGVCLSQSEKQTEEVKHQPEETEDLPKEGEILLSLDANATTQASTNALSKKRGSSASQANQHILRKLFRTVVDFFDLTLLLDPVYVNIVIGNSFAFFADITFFLLLPLMLFGMDYSKSATALCMSMGAGGDLAGRLFLIGLGLWMPGVSSRLLLWIGALMAVVFRTAFAAVNSFVAVSVLTTVLGFFRAWIMVTGPLVFAEYNAERFPSAFGLNMVINGLIAIVAGPLVGWVRDTTNSYAICTHALSAMTAVCVLLWAVESVILKTKLI